MPTVPDWYWLVFGAVSLFAALQFLWQERRTPGRPEGLIERLGRLAWSLGLIGIGVAAPDVPAWARVLMVLAGCLMLLGVTMAMRRQRPRPD